MSVAAATAATVTTATVPLTLFPPSPPSVWVPAHIILSSNNSSMSAPPVPPRPPTTQPGTPGPGRRPPLPPPPPLPTGFRPDVDPYQESPPRFGDPMLAPRPQKLLSSVPADVSTSHPLYSSVFAVLARREGEIGVTWHAFSCGDSDFASTSPSISPFHRTRLSPPSHRPRTCRHIDISRIA